MQLSQSLFIQFLKNECSSEEEAAVIAFFKRNPGAINQYLEQQEWDAINNTKNLPTDVSAQMLSHINTKLFSDTPGKTYKNNRRLYAQWAAAAVVLFIAGLWLFNSNQTTGVTSNTAATASTGEKKEQSKVDLWKVHFNNKDKQQKIVLGDGSVVTLYPKSSIRYKTDFAKGNRNVYMEGIAFYEVAKDKKRPFTVFGGNLSTTALGTSFMVTALKNAAQDVSVKLYTGKVMIRLLKSLPGWKKDTVLNPGQQLIYSPASQTMMVTTFEKLLNNKPVVSKTTDEISFSNEALYKVFDEIMAFRNIHIQYNKEEVKGMNFTGSISLTDDAAIIVNVIAQMNRLKVIAVPDNNSFVIVPADEK